MSPQDLISPGQAPAPMAQAKPAFNVYNTMLIVSFAAILISVLLMYLEGRRYDWDVRAKGAGAVGAGAPATGGPTTQPAVPMGGGQPPGGVQAPAGQPAAGEQAPAGGQPAVQPGAGQAQ